MTAANSAQDGRDVGERAVAGSIWLLGSRLGQQGVLLIQVAVLARLLDPTAFGLVGLADLAAQAIAVFVYTGYEFALIQKSDLREIDIHTAWWVMLARYVAIGGCLMALAGPIARFYRVPEAIPVLRAIGAIQAQEEKAVISASDTLAQAGSLMTNENALPYKARGYEKVFVYHFQALNYLFQGNIEGASVEVRRANQEQVLALERHLKEVDKAHEELEEHKVDHSAVDAKVEQTYAEMDAIIADVKNSLQNAYTFYMSGVFWEIAGEPNDAYIDYKKALEIYPENPYVQQDVIRLAKTLGMSDEYDAFTTRYPEAAAVEGRQPYEAETGEVVILFEEGFVPQMQGITLPIPTPNGLVTASFPIYRSPRQSTAPFSAYAGDQVLGGTAPICDVYALAAKSLKERLPMMITREVLRAVAKGVIQKQVVDEAGLLGGALTSLYNIATAGADLRAWYTLPYDVQMMRATLPAGAHTLRLVHERTRSTVEPVVNLRAGGTVVIRLVLCGGKPYYQAIEL